MDKMQQEGLAHKYQSNASVFAVFSFIGVQKEMEEMKSSENRKREKKNLR